MKNLAIIPARTGSKGVPGKNTKLLGGVPLVLWTVDAAMMAGKAEFSELKPTANVPAPLDEKLVCWEPVFDTIVVTTNDTQIAEMVTNWARTKEFYGVKNVFPYLRHDKLAQDHVQTDEVVLDLLRQMELSDNHFDNICLLQPTSPFRTYQHIYESWEMYKSYDEIGCLISGVKSESGYHWYSDENGYCEPLGHNPTFRLGRQWEKPLPDVYRENGAIYWFKAEQFSLRRFYRMPPYAIYPMDNESSIDINTMDDWNIAEEIVSKWKKHRQ